MSVSKLLSVALLLGVISANADVYTTWQGAAGFYFSADPNAGFLGAGNSALAQLIWRPDNAGAYAGTDIANVNNPNFVSGGDVFLTDFLLTEGVNTSEWGDFHGGGFTDGGVQPDGGFIYARIFESDDIQVGTRYYVGPVVAAANLDSSDPLVTPQSYQMNRDLVLGNAIDDPSFGFQVVPEPGTIALLALGIATLGGAAHKKRKAVLKA